MKRNCSETYFYCLFLVFSRVMTVMGTIENCSGVLNDVLVGLASVSQAGKFGGKDWEVNFLSLTGLS